VLQKLEGGWWEGKYNGQIGWFPTEYVQKTAVEAKPAPAPAARALQDSNIYVRE
jgi:hypothetical protein